MDSLSAFTLGVSRDSYLEPLHFQQRIVAFLIPSIVNSIDIPWQTAAALWPEVGWTFANPVALKLFGAPQWTAVSV